MTRWLTPATVVAIIATIVADKVHYIGYSVYRVVPVTDEQLALLVTLANNDTEHYNFWNFPSHLNQTVDVMASPEVKEIFVQNLAKVKLEYQIIIDDVDNAISADEPKFENLQSESGPLNGKAFFSKYQRLNAIYSFMDRIKSTYPSVVSIDNIGKTWEGRNMRLFKIGLNKGNKPIIWMDAGIHAREWIAPATAMYMAWKLAADHESDAATKSLLEKYDWYILPVANPDGYEFSHTKDRMWRKTRSVHRKGMRCPGVDPNRNWNFHWMEGGASLKPCTEIFAGPKAFSEPEVRAMSNTINANKAWIKAYLTIHSYGQMWMNPWGYTKNLPPDYKAMMKKASVAVNALKSVYGTKYGTGSAAKILYVTSGASDDWAYGVAGIKYSYTIELRAKEKQGFLLPRKQIIPTGVETLAGVKAFAEEVYKDAGTKTKSVRKRVKRAKRKRAKKRRKQQN